MADARTRLRDHDPDTFCDAVGMRLSPGEPAFGPWRVEPLGSLVRFLSGGAGSGSGRPAIVAVDGRSSSGKTSLARRLAAATAHACVVHTDDIAWRQSAFDWADVLVEGVLRPLHQGLPVEFRPAAWDLHDRPGCISVPVGADVVIVEGVGAGRREVADLVDGIAWVQCDVGESARRNAVRVAAGEISPANFASWMAEENPFVADQRVWERASLIVAGSTSLPHVSASAVVADATSGSSV